MSEQLNLDRKPTPADLKILAWMESGQSINNLQAITQFKNAMLRDAIWRLKKAGYPITSAWVKYTTSEGKQKKYKSYFITPPSILSAGVKTEVAYRKGVDNVTDHAKRISELTGKATVVQDLFPAYQECLKK